MAPAQDTSPPPQSSLNAPDDAIKILPPVERKSAKVGPWEFSKNIFMTVVIAKVGFLVGYLAGAHAPASMLSKDLQELQKLRTPHLPSPLSFLGNKSMLGQYVGTITGLAAGFYEAWRHWKKEKSKQLGVQEVHKDIYDVLDPKILEAETAQNERIQNGIKKIIEERKPRSVEARGSFTDAATREEPSAGAAIS